MKKLSLVVVLVLAVLGVSSCSSAPETPLDVSPTGAYNKKNPEELRRGGTLTLPIAEIPEQQNALHANATVSVNTLWNWYMPQMFHSDSEGNTTPNPNYLLDTREEVVGGKTVVHYTLNPRATFNDGTPIDWRSFENTWRINRGDNAAYQLSSSDGYNLIESVRPGEDDKQVVVSYKHIYPWWNSLFRNSCTRLLPRQKILMRVSSNACRMNGERVPTRWTRWITPAAPSLLSPMNGGGAPLPSSIRWYSARWKRRRR